MTTLLERSEFVAKLTRQQKEDRHLINNPTEWRDSHGHRTVVLPLIRQNYEWEFPELGFIVAHNDYPNCIVFLDSVLTYNEIVEEGNRNIFREIERHPYPTVSAMLKDGWKIDR